jgi:hypothetical protein
VAAWLPLALLSLLVVVAHARALGSDLVYDGRSQIGEGAYIHETRHFGDVLTLRVLGHDVLDNNRPTQLLSLMLDALVWGHRPFGFHLTNLALHLLCVGLLYGFLRRFGAPPGPAGCAAAVFAVHPLVVEVVAEPSYREDLLVALFSLLALRLWCWQPAERRAQLARAAGVVLCALLAVGSKESGAAVVPILLAAEALRPGSFRRRSLWLLGVTTLVVVTFLWARFAFAPDPSEIFPVRPQRLGGSLAATFVIQLRIFALYLGHLVWPVGLSADYTPGAIAGVPVWLGGLALVVVLGVQGALLRAAWRHELRGLAGLSVIWFWATFLPVANLVPMYRPAADRYLYVPLAGVVVALAVALTWLWPRKLAAGAALSALSVGVVLATAASIARQGVFASELALWEDTLRVSPDSTTAMNNQAWALLDVGRVDEARAGFQSAVAATAARDADPLVGLAIASGEGGDRVTAQRALQAALALDAIYGQPEKLQRTMRMTAAQIARLRVLLAR